MVVDICQEGFEDFLLFLSLRHAYVRHLPRQRGRLRDVINAVPYGVRETGYGRAWKPAPTENAFAVRRKCRPLRGYEELDTGGHGNPPLRRMRLRDVINAVPYGVRETGYGRAWKPAPTGLIKPRESDRRGRRSLRGCMLAGR